MAYIYTITNNINSKKYVGKTSHSNPNIRWSQHKQLAKKDPTKYKLEAIHYAIRKHKVENFKYTIIEECSEINVNLRETHWITLLDTYKSGYNCTLGGEGTKLDPKDYGKYRESREVDCYTLEGQFVRTFLSITAAKYWAVGDTKGTENNNLVNALKGRTSQAYGYKWAYKDTPLINMNVRTYSTKKIIGTNPEFGWVKCWKNQADCAEDLNNNRKDNCGVNISLSSPLSKKKSCKGWYLFWGDKLPSKYTPVKKGNSSNKARMQRKVKAIDVNNPDNVITFNSLSEASYYIKGDGNRSAVGNIHNNIKNLQSNKNWMQAYGYQWFYLK